MADSAVIQDMLTLFYSQHRPTKTPERALSESWDKALARYPNRAVKIAGQKCMEECQKMPTLHDVIERMPDLHQEDDFILRNNTKCEGCGHIGAAILEPIKSGHWRCCECYSGFTRAEIKAKWRTLIDIMDKSLKNVA